MIFVSYLPLFLNNWIFFLMNNIIFSEGFNSGEYGHIVIIWTSVLFRNSFTSLHFMYWSVVANNKKSRIHSFKYIDFIIEYITSKSNKWFMTMSSSCFEYPVNSSYRESNDKRHIEILGVDLLKSVITFGSPSIYWFISQLNTKFISVHQFIVFWIENFLSQSWFI